MDESFEEHVASDIPTPDFGSKQPVEAKRKCSFLETLQKMVPSFDVENYYNAISSANRIHTKICWFKVLYFASNRTFLKKKEEIRLFKSKKVKNQTLQVATHNFLQAQLLLVNEKHQINFSKSNENFSAKISSNVPIYSIEFNPHDPHSLIASTSLGVVSVKKNTKVLSYEFEFDREQSKKLSWLDGAKFLKNSPDMTLTCGIFAAKLHIKVLDNQNYTQYKHHIVNSPPKIVHWHHSERLLFYSNPKVPEIHIWHISQNFHKKLDLYKHKIIVRDMISQNYNYFFVAGTTYSKPIILCFERMNTLTEVITDEANWEYKIFWQQEIYKKSDQGVPIFMKLFLKNDDIYFLIVGVHLKNDGLTGEKALQRCKVYQLIKTEFKLVFKYYIKDEINISKSKIKDATLNFNPLARKDSQRYFKISLYLKKNQNNDKNLVVEIPNQIVIKNWKGKIYFSNDFSSQPSINKFNFIHFFIQFLSTVVQF